MQGAFDDPQTKERLRNAAGAGLGVTGALAAAQSIPHALRDYRESKMPKANAWKDFLGKLSPADVVYYRQYGAKDQKSLGHIYDLLSGIKGDEFVHPSVYRGKGLISEAGGTDIPVLNNVRMSGSHYPIEAKAYRFADMGEAEKKKAFKYLDAMKGTPYKSTGGVTEHGIKHLAGVKIPTTGSVCKTGKNGIVCSELVAEAFPKRFKDRLMSPMDMRHAPKSELVARYGKALPIPLRERMLARVGYPLVKNAKWGALAAAGMYGAQALLGDKNEPDGT